MCFSALDVLPIKELEGTQRTDSNEWPGLKCSSATNERMLDFLMLDDASSGKEMGDNRH